MSREFFGLGKLVKRMLADPVYKNYYCLRVVDNRGEIIVTPVIDHDFLTKVVIPGLTVGLASRSIKSFEYLASRLSEDEATDIMYQEIDYINQTLEGK